MIESCDVAVTSGIVVDVPFSVHITLAVSFKGMVNG
jgi:hypothetical protein